MQQEVKVTVELTLSLPTDKTKDEVKNGVEGLFTHLRTNLHSTLVNELSRYKDGDALNDLVQAKVIDVKEENEIYNTENNKEVDTGRILKVIMERYGSLVTLKTAMWEDEDVVLVNLSDDLNDELSELDILNYIHKILG